MLKCCTGPHPGSARQMDTDRRRDLGQSDRAGTEPARRESVRPSAGPHRQRLG